MTQDAIVIQEPFEVQIVEYDHEKHHAAYKEMNIAWISVYWKLEKRDYEELDDVQTLILDKGGFILMAVVGELPIGCVVMLPMDDGKFHYEFAKFTTTEQARGRGVGKLLANTAMDKAREEVRKRNQPENSKNGDDDDNNNNTNTSKNTFDVLIYTNQLCVTAIKMYEKLGFVRVPGHSALFERGDTIMEYHEQL